MKRVGEKGQLETVIEQFDKLDSISAQIVLREAYDLDYGIFDHDNRSDRPLALVARHDKEDYNEYGALYRAIYQFSVNDIYKNWGLSLTEFLKLPREFHRLVLRISGEDAQRALKPTEQQIKDLQNAAKGGKKK